MTSVLGRAILVLAVLALAAPARASEAPRPLRVVTFNLFHGGPASGWIGDAEALQDRLALATTELRALAPDVIAVQEASIGWGRGNVAARLAEALGMTFVYAPATTHVFPIPFVNHVIVRAINFAEGSAVLSRFPIVASEVYELPRCVKRLDPRIALRAELRTPWGELSVVSTHLSREDCQVARVGEIVRAHATAHPALLMGDFNASDTLPAIAALHADGLVDAFRAANPEARGFTVWQRPWAPEPTAFRRVDYIFVAGAGRDAVCGSRVVLDRPQRLPDGRTLWPSDHYGVLADLRLFGIKCAP